MAYDLHDMKWRDDALYLPRRTIPLAVIAPDPVYPKMWRYLIGGVVSGMLNKSRTKQAARFAACRVLNAQEIAKRRRSRALMAA